MIKKLTELQFPINKDACAKIWLIGEVTQESIDKLIEILLLEKDTFPTKEDLAASVLESLGEGDKK